MAERSRLASPDAPPADPVPRQTTTSQNSAGLRAWRAAPELLSRTELRSSSPVRRVMPSDVRTLVNGFAKNPLQTRREGLYFKEKDYKCVRADDYSLYAKNENTGVVVVKTHLYLLVATYTEGMYPSVCVEATEKLGEYLRRKGN
ncbi:profilin-4 isoform X1 [Neofelis nebulosa]|uniref:profilin-4 isoform X1 n=1 Tax=Neofelis nebulosa TaxID=61452 RepID=UPI00272BFADF|nr:profilin-4 isoform X1 [Neofelis nebulosa]